MSQERQFDAILKRFNMTDAKAVNSPADTSTQLQKATDEEHNDFLTSKFPYQNIFIGYSTYTMCIYINLMASTTLNRTPCDAFMVSQLTVMIRKIQIFLIAKEHNSECCLTYHLFLM